MSGRTFESVCSSREIRRDHLVFNVSKSWFVCGGGASGKLKIKKLAESNVKKEIRGLEQYYYDKLKPPLNKIRPNRPKNIEVYEKAADMYDKLNEPKLYRIAN